ncbi:MAG: double zinc ribbon domain-containing protein [Pseudomonadota bacterium]
MGLQALLHIAYPPQCISCGARVTSDFGLCGDCWRDTPFITGLVCNHCGVLLPGEEADAPVLCDDCLTIARPWRAGRAALLYHENGRKLVLALKHADRLDIAHPAAAWMTKAAQPLLVPDMLVAPVPLHWWRLVQRRYNQAAVLSARIARLAGLSHCPDLLQRPRNTGSQEGRSRDGRFHNMSGALTLHPRRAARVQGRHVLLVDDVMTSGATLAAAAEACLAAGASDISVLVMARVAKQA